METRANFVLIGSFTLAVIAAAFGFVLWFQSLHTTKARSPLRVVFEGPATGLRNGGSVNFNGIRVGEVISVKLDNPRRVVALAMVENNAPIRKDTLVGLKFQGLTVFMVTHDLDSLYTACDRIAVLGNGKIIAAGSMADMQASEHPWLRAYFHGKRARAVMG